MVQVRWAARGDAPKVYPLFRALVEAERSTPPSPAEFSRTWARSFQDKSPFRFVVAEGEQHRLLACLSLHEHFSTWKGKTVYSLEDFYVLPEERGKGIGQAMLAFVDAHAVQRGAARIELDVRVDNDRAQRLYQRSGYQEQPYRWYHKVLTRPQAPAAPPAGSERAKPKGQGARQRAKGRGRRR